jgi:hypothetical protein
VIRKGSWDMLPIFQIIEQKSGVPDEELYQVFNMGIGMVSIVSADKADAVLKFIKRAKAQGLAHRRSGEGQGRGALTSAGFLHRDLGKRNISLLEFICERGVPHLYYAAFSDDVIPIGTILAEVNSINGKNVFKNYSLRKNLKSRTPAEQIYGGLNPAPK